MTCCISFLTEKELTSSLKRADLYGEYSQQGRVLSAPNNTDLLVGFPVAGSTQKQVLFLHCNSS